MFCVISCFDMNENMGLCWSCIDLAFNTFQLTSCIKTFCYKPHIKLIVLHVYWFVSRGILFTPGNVITVYTVLSCFLCQNIKTNNRFFYNVFQNDNSFENCLAWNEMYAPIYDTFQIFQGFSPFDHTCLRQQTVFGIVCFFKNSWRLVCDTGRFQLKW